MNISGVPQSIPRKAIADVLRTWGIDPSTVIADVRITREAVMCEVVARDADGRPIRDGQRFARHHIVIAITDTP